MKKRRTFWDGDDLCSKLDAIPENELSTIIRMALRAWFKIDSKPELTVTDARQIAQELVRQRKVERSER